MVHASAIRRFVRKLIPPGIWHGVDYKSLTFFLYDMKNCDADAGAGENFVTVPRIARANSSREHYHCHNFDSTRDPLLSRLCEYSPDKRFYRRMRHGYQQCYVLSYEQDIVAYAWVTTSACYVSELDFMLPVGVGRFYIYDCFVDPGFRNRGLYQALLSKIIADYARLNWPGPFSAACIAAETGNAASVKGIRRSGFKDFVRARYIRIGKTSRLYGTDTLIAFMNSAADPFR